MRVSKTTSAGQKPEHYMKAADNDLINLFNAFKGRIRLGSGTTSTTVGVRGENIAGEFRYFLSGVGTDNAIQHSLGCIPIGFFLINKSGFGDIYMKTASATSATFSTTQTATNYSVFLLK